MNGHTRGKQALARALGAVLAAAVWRGAAAQDPSASQVHWWGGFGLGYGYLRAAPGPAPSGAGGLWLEVQVGARLGTHWLTGFELGGLGMQFSKGNYDTHSSDPNVYGQDVTNELFVVQYAPRLDRGWFVGAGAGGLLYHNKALERMTLNQRSGNGTALLARCGYDFRIRQRTHLDVDFSYERGSIRLNAPLSGRSDFSLFAAGFRLSYHGL